MMNDCPLMQWPIRYTLLRSFSLQHWPKLPGKRTRLCGYFRDCQATSGGPKGIEATYWPTEPLPATSLLAVNLFSLKI
jgi:hypothetical protein